MEHQEREALKRATELAQARAPKGTKLTHVAWRNGHLEAGYTRPVPEEGLALIAAKAELPAGFEPRPKRVKRSIVQVELPL